MDKIAPSLSARVMTAGVLLAIGILLSGFVYERFISRSRELQNRSDYPQIAAACVTLARGITNGTLLFEPTDPKVPMLLRSLSPRYIGASPNQVTLEFAGGFDHYGYRVRQSATNSREWAISYYTEQGSKLLATITNGCLRKLRNKSMSSG